MTTTITTIATETVGVKIILDTTMWGLRTAMTRTMITTTIITTIVMAVRAEVDGRG